MTYVGWSELSHAYTATSIARMCTHVYTCTYNCVTGCILLSITVDPRTQNKYCSLADYTQASAAGETCMDLIFFSVSVSGSGTTAYVWLYCWFNCGSLDPAVLPFWWAFIIISADSQPRGYERSAETRGQCLTMIGWWMILKEEKKSHGRRTFFITSACLESQRILIGSRYLK